MRSIAYRVAFALVCLADLQVFSKNAAAQEQLTPNGTNAFASHIVLGHADGSYLGATKVPLLHSKGLRGFGQIVGLGDTGINVASCSFRDDTVPVPYSTVSQTHRKIVSYQSVNGDTQDGPDGHGSHIAGSICGESLDGDSSQPDNGMAPAARLVVVDVEKATNPGSYQVPVASIGTSYFDYFRKAGANVACSPWSFNVNAALDTDVDTYVYQNVEFLPVYPSGNAFTQGAADALMPDSPCSAKNVLCVGASYNARQMYLEQPSFVHTVVQLGSTSCRGSGRDACAEELKALPALFGPTAPAAALKSSCDAIAVDCLNAGAACPECAFGRNQLASVQDAIAVQASPPDACSSLAGFLAGAVCVVQRGVCNFATKAMHCAAAGAVGVVIVNSASQPQTLMQDTNSEATGLSIPVVLVTNSDGPRLLVPGRLLTLPVISRQVDPHVRAPYSSYGPLSNGRIKPEVVLPGDGISSTAASKSCGFKQMSGTSQSCGVAAGAVTLVREYLQTWAHPGLAKLSRPWASMLKAVLIAAAEVSRDPASTGVAKTLLSSEVGFGLPALASVFSVPAGTGLITVQSHADSAGPQRFCLSLLPTDSASPTPSVSLVWTDPPDSSNLLVNDLDLEVACDTGGWTRRLGNGGASQDRVNNVEKVMLLDLPANSSGLCVVSVAALSVSKLSPQPFSLVAAGAFAPSLACLASSARPSCVHGVAVRLLASVSGSTAGWDCRCERPWLGVFCDQVAETLSLSDRAASSATLVPLSLRPWQWSFARAAWSCGAGAYELLLEDQSADGQALEVTVSWGHMEVSTLSADSTAAAAASGITFTSTSEAAGLGSRTTIIVQIPASASSQASSVSEIYVALRSKGRDGPSTYTLRWQPAASVASSCKASALRGATGGVDLPTEQIVLYCILGLVALAVPLACYGAWKFYSRRHAYARKSAPEPVTLRNQPVSACWSPNSVDA
ncbi:unnamed protein product [Polarella glacialis]|uniref:subtilisin n=1 Tax=Polarella glacialis TaxID=89957 RepID=A0A813JLF4_POLGL|nr:unnamed protein product [Polarella glacialis]